VLTRQMPVTDDLSKLAQSLNPPASLGLWCKGLCTDLEGKAAKTLRDALESDLIDSLVAQRSLCPPPLKRIKDEIILSRPLALMPLFMLALLRFPALSHLAGTGLSPDQTVALLETLRRLPLHLTCLMLLPRLHLIHRRGVSDGWAFPPDKAISPTTPTPPTPPEATSVPQPRGAPLQPSSSAPSEDGHTETSSDAVTRALVDTVEVLMPAQSEIASDGIYLLDTLQELVLWVGSQSAPSFVEALFGTKTPADNAPLLPRSANEHSARLQKLVETLRSQRPQYAPLRVVVQGSLQQQRFMGRLFGDGYDSFMLHLQSMALPKL